MKNKSLFLTLVLLALGGSLFGQTLTPAASSTGSITVNAANCNTTNACIILHMASSNVGYSVTASGTWTGTLTVEQSGDNQGSWTSATTTTANTLFTSALTPGITDARVRGSAAMTGTAVVTITASGPATLQQITQTGSSSSSPSSPAPIVATYLSNVCQVANTGQCFFTSADTLIANDCTWTNASTTVTCNTAHFTSAAVDVGKNAMGGATCAGDQLSATNAGAIATTTAVTIATFIGTTSVTLSATPANSSGSVNSLGPCFIWGHIDDVGAAAVNTALQASLNCPKLMLAASNYYVTKPFWFANPPGCIAIGANVVGANFGQISLPAGFEVEGRGRGATAVFMDTSFPNGDTCAHISGSSAVGACWAIPVMGGWSDFRLDGGAQSTAPNLAGKTLVTMAVANMTRTLCMNMGPFGSSIGLNSGYQTFLTEYNNAGCGATGISTEAGTGLSHWERVVVENSPTALVLNGGGGFNGSGVTCHWCFFTSTLNTTNTPVVRNNGTPFNMYGGAIWYANNNVASNTGMTGYRDDGGTLGYFDGVTFNFNHGTAGSFGNVALRCQVAGCVIKLIGSVLTNLAPGASYFDVGGGTLVDLGGNDLKPGNLSLVAGSTIIADGHSLLGICTGVATASSALALNISGLSTTGTGIPTTCTSTTLDKGQAMQQARTLHSLMCSSSATTVSVACTVLVNGVASALTCTMTAATSCNDVTHTVAVVKGDLISERIVTGAAETGANVKAFVMWQ